MGFLKGNMVPKNLNIKNTQYSEVQSAHFPDDRLLTFGSGYFGVADTLRMFGISEITCHHCGHTSLVKYFLLIFFNGSKNNIVSAECPKCYNNSKLVRQDGRFFVYLSGIKELVNDDSTCKVCDCRVLPENFNVMKSVGLYHLICRNCAHDYVPDFIREV